MVTAQPLSSPARVIVPSIRRSCHSMWHLRPSSAGHVVIDLDLLTPSSEARPTTSEAETRSTKKRRQDEPGPSSASKIKGQSVLDKQRQESVATALQLYANPQEAGIKLLLPPLMDITDNPFTLCPTENMATCCLHSKWAPFAVFGQLLDGLPSMQAGLAPLLSQH